MCLGIEAEERLLVIHMPLLLLGIENITCIMAKHISSMVEA